MRDPILRASLLIAVSALLGACSPATPTPGGDVSRRTVDLVMTEQATFEPDTVEVRRGETVVFRVRNLSGVTHEAYIGTDEEQQLHETVHAGLPADQQTTTTHMGYAVHVPPFGNGDLIATFDRAYEYVIGCHYPGHYAAGMRAVIQVLE